MTLSPAVLLVVLLGAATAGGCVLLVHALTPQEPSEAAGPENSLLTRIRAFGTRVPFAVAAAVLVLLLTKWLVAAIAAGIVVLLWDQLFGGGSEEKAGIAQIEGLAAWTESLRDTVAGAVGLEQAIPATAFAAAPAIQSDLEALADRLRVRVPLPAALQRFADDMDDSSADLIIATLILSSRLRGPGLREVLTSLAESARAELEMRQRVSAGRRSTRRSVQIVVGITMAFVVGLALFNPAYVAPYGTPIGQVVLLFIVGIFAVGVWWLRRLSRFEGPERFLYFRDKEASA